MYCLGFGREPWHVMHVLREAREAVEDLWPALLVVEGDGAAFCFFLFEAGLSFAVEDLFAVLLVVEVDGAVLDDICFFLCEAGLSSLRLVHMS